MDSLLSLRFGVSARAFHSFCFFPIPSSCHADIALSRKPPTSSHQYGSLVVGILCLFFRVSLAAFGEGVFFFVSSVRFRRCISRGTYRFRVQDGMGRVERAIVCSGTRWGIQGLRNFFFKDRKKNEKGTMLIYTSGPRLEAWRVWAVGLGFHPPPRGTQIYVARLEWWRRDGIGEHIGSLFFSPEG